ncbi:MULTISPECIES: MBL fold metallo-hydrolase [Cytobacillus]|jgi:glyoxylase-like metal-dependent hydrolase (beta-lactamase superfamily II)|uniref:Metal-dependent hydrolase n=3 Tax=Cytobacillus TaxID=2675230 RepID=A0A160MFY0_9BACI|nr:MBL fold metallo-hydrolase [Cytobacillus oceanisediminis]EFV78460.1 beta-lactamase domain-containing protein [Bacillus sp. 2_A_57_CT2]MBY0158767.1 MBL fold metallo-hydrolase [Cytobacillus firmus]AND42186.1 metal-dependent hydrolase [Cytobacillus oceanisediminis 2691]MCM3529163.1 MBL fold metallo-hydrolase [Cytobacillus oceanisediminis]OHX49828.1 metal-dependent hydrolase [Cytobacillus oceanisediminis]
MKIIELPIEFESNGQKNYIYPSLIILNNELTLVDTGYTNFFTLIENEILKNRHEIKNLKNIIITHYDDDHIGSLYDFKERCPWINIIASEIESKYISGEIKSERLVQAEEMLENMPNEEMEFGKWFIQQLKNLKHVSIDEKVNDGDMILDNKCKVISTPGHTSGHISLYFPSLKSVITGDAAVKENDELVIANPQFCLNVEKAEQSLTKIKNLKAENYYCYHGGKLTL